MNSTHPTLRDVAALAGVSHQTVSRVINGDVHVSPETRQKVESAIAELNYHPNAFARSMASGRSHILAAISPNLVDYTFASNHEGAELESRQHGYVMLNSSANTKEDFQALLDQLMGRQLVDGIIVFNPYIDRKFTLLPLKIPLVFCGGKARDDAPFTVFLDNIKGAADATNHLISLGHTKLAEVTGPLEEDCAQERHLGVQSALSAHNLSIPPQFIVEGDWTASSGYQIFQNWYSTGNIPTGVIAQNDRMAIGIIKAARDHGIHVPEALSVIGFDDMPLSSYFDPPLTTIRQDTFGLGRKAARLLIDVIENRNYQPEQISIPTELVIRNSTAPIERR